MSPSGQPAAAQRYFVDTNVFLYARGGQHRYREPCRDLLAAVADARVRLVASVELIQEFAHVLLRRGLDRAHALSEASDVRRVCTIQSFDGAILTAACDLLRQYPSLGARDAVHAATAIASGLPAIVITDRAFEGLADLERLDPVDLAGDLGRPKVPRPNRIS